jgi:hypothetical protein
LRSTLLLFLAACTGGSPGKDDDTGETAAGGFSSVLAAADVCGEADLGCLGQSGVAVDSSGRTFVAVGVDDPNQDGTYDDAVIELFVSDDAGGWTGPTALGGAGQLDTDYERQVSLAVDPTDDDAVTAAWFDSASGDVFVATSNDGGASFSTDTVASAVSPYELAVDQRAGATALVLVASELSTHGALYQRGTPGGPWSSADLPARADDGARASEVLDEGVALRFRPTDAVPFVTYFLEPPEAYNTRLVAWTPGQPTAAVVMDSADQQNDWADCGLAFDGGTAWVAALLDDGSGENARLGSSADGATWTAPVGIPNDAGDTYAWDIAVTASSGRVSTAIEVGGGSDDRGCGDPKLVVTADGGATFDLCTLDGAVDVGMDGLDSAESAAGRRIVFVSTEAYGALPAGLIAWTE